jgi:hypothetical protein
MHWILGIGAIFLASAGAAAWAHGHGAHRRPEAVIDDALAAAHLSPAQKEAIDAAREHVRETTKAAFAGHRGQVEQALDLFAADRLDTDKIAELRRAHQAQAKQIADAITLAVTDAHNALTRDQRQAVVQSLRTHVQEAGGHGGGRDKWAHKMMESRLNDALATVHATPAQKATLTQAAERLFASFAQNRRDHLSHVSQGLDLFAADRLDAKQVEQFRAQREQDFERHGDAMMDLIKTAHDTLSKDQRSALVGYMRAQMEQHHPEHDE